MSRFTIEPSTKGDSDWAVHKDGEPVAWFMGTNAAERFIAAEEAFQRSFGFERSSISMARLAKMFSRDAGRG